MEEDTAPPVEQEPARCLPEALSEIYHDLNNALSVISGNTQLLSEQARAERMGAAFLEPLKDIEAAHTEIFEVLDRLDRLRQEFEQD